MKEKSDKSNEKFLIRECNPQDLSSLKKIYKECYQFHEKRGFKLRKIEKAPDLFVKYVNEHINDANALILVAEVGGKVVGYCFARILEKPPVYRENEYGEIDNISVLEDHQRQGMGEQLFKKALKWFKSKNIKFIEVGVALKNEKSNSFWSKMGFEKHMEIKLLEIKK